MSPIEFAALPSRIFGRDMHFPQFLGVMPQQCSRQIGTVAVFLSAKYGCENNTVVTHLRDLVGDFIYIHKYVCNYICTLHFQP